MKAFYLFLAGAVVLLIAGTIGIFLGDKAHFLLWLVDYRFLPGNYFFYYVTSLGEFWGFVICGVILWIQYTWRRMLTIPALGLIVTLVTYLLKQTFNHERPVLYLNKIGWEGEISVLGYHVVTGHTSFPSGHSMAAWALFTLMAAHIKKPWFSLLCLFLATAVSISRVYLMVHFLQDVVVGAMIGIVLGYTVYYAYEKWIIQLPGRRTKAEDPATSNA